MRTLARLLMGGLCVSAASADNGSTGTATPAAASDHEANAAYFTGNRPPLVPSKYLRLPTGAVRPQGWLRRQLRIQADGLTSWTWSAFESGSHDANPPYHQEGVVALALVLRDERLLKLARGYVDRRLTGPSSEVVDFPSASIMRFMMEYQEATRDARIIPWMCEWYRNADWLKGRDGWQGQGREEHLGPLLWLYNRTGDAKWLELVKTHFAGPPNYQPVWVNPAAIAEAWLQFPDHRLSNHGVVLTWRTKYPGLLYQFDPKEDYRRSVFEGLRRLDQYYGQIGGRYAAHETLPPDINTGRDPRHGSELCQTVECGYNMGRLFEWFGETSCIDRLESQAYNTWPGEMTPDMWTHQYDTQANQAVVSVANRGWDNTAWANLYGLIPHWPCCLANMHQAWPRFVSSMWMATPDRGLAATAYGPCEVIAQVGDHKQAVTIVEETDYPFDGAIGLTIRTAEPAAFPLQLRVPGWAKNAVACVGNETFTAAPGSMLSIVRTWRQGDKVDFRFPMEIRVEERFKRALAVMRGPLYFSLRIGQDYREAQSCWTGQPGLAAKPIREKSGFPLFDWEIFPTTPWNYGLVVDARQPGGSVKVLRHSIGEFPFAQKGEPVIRRVAENPQAAPFKAEVSQVAPHPAESDLSCAKQAWSLSGNEDQQWVGFERTTSQADEPVILRVKARLIPQWTMTMGLNPASNTQVPAMAGPTPESPVTVAGPEVDVELVPYGCTRLRMSEFPVITP
ncbi:MAG: glycoside hydrolase family 127 protein [Verrucomicrobia bacterium]|nr:glycoside hydrolase family 127 protein [Verrucomicrobiota bacterium]